MRSPFGAGLLFFVAVMFVFVVGAHLDVNVFDHYDRGLGRGISVSILSWFAPMAALLSTPGYVIALSRTRYVPGWSTSVAAGSLVTIAAWVLAWTTLIFVEVSSPVTSVVAAVAFLAGGFLAVYIAKRLHVLPTSPS